MNKKGVTMVELLAYLSLVSIVIVLFNGMMSYVLRTYDTINGKGAFYNEATNMVSLVTTKINSFNPQYVRSCVDGSEDCIEFVVQSKREVDPELGIISYVAVDEVVTLKVVPNGEYYDLYLIHKIRDLTVENSDYQVINNIKLNNNRFGLVDKLIDETTVDESFVFIDYQSIDENNSTTLSQNAIIIMNFNMKAIKNNNPVGEHYTFENKFAF
jgi:hypothetical protein